MAWYIACRASVMLYFFLSFFSARRYMTLAPTHLVAVCLSQPLLADSCELRLM